MWGNKIRGRKRIEEGEVGDNEKKLNTAPKTPKGFKWKR